MTIRMIPSLSALTPGGTPGTNIVQSAIDWQSFSKTLVLEAGFVAALAAVISGHGTTDIVSLLWGIGGTLGILGITDRVTNSVNVRSYLNAPNAGATGVVPQAPGTSLVQAATITPTGGTNASAPTA